MQTNTQVSLRGNKNIIYSPSRLEGNRLVSPTGRDPGRGGAEGMSWQGRVEAGGQQQLSRPERAREKQGKSKKTREHKQSPK